MKARLSFVLLLTLASMARAQQSFDHQKADSLRKMVRGTSGVDKASALFEFAKLYTKNNLDSSKLLFEDALSVCRSLRNDTAVVRFICQFAPRLSDAGERELARHYLVMARDMESEAVRVPRFRVMIYKQLFDLNYWYSTDYDSCIYYAQLWIDHAPDSVNKGWGYTELGVSHSEMGNNVKALEIYTIASDYLQSSKPNLWMLSHLNNNLGMLYSDERELEKAEEFFLKALDYSHNSGEPGADLPQLNNLGVLYIWLGEYEKALQYLARSAALLPLHSGNLWAKANNILNVGHALTLSGKPREGLEKFRESLQIFQGLKEEYKVASLNIRMAEAYRLLGQYAEAERQGLSALEQARKNGYGDLIKEGNQELYKIYGASRQFTKAFDYQSRYLTIVDSLNSLERKRELGLVDKNYQLAQQQKLRERLEQENKLGLAQVESSRNTQILLGVGTIVLAIAVVIAVVAYRRSRAKNEILNRQKKKIEEQALQLEEAAKTKARFFANVSHELRTPVTLLNGMLELMQADSGRDGSPEKMTIALESSRRLQGMLNEVLDLSRVEAGKWELVRKKKEILPLLTRIVLAFESLMIQKRLRLDFEANVLEGLWMDIDEDKFEKIINNLVYNAIKFNHEDGWIRVTGNRTESSIVVQVTDSGIGIPEKEQPHIFDRFYQSSSTEKLNAQGIGIGLSLVREFAELHGGSVTVTSRVNEGSCFTIELPIVNASLAPAETDSADEEVDVSFDSFATMPTVLVVEDNDEMRYYLKEILGPHVAISEARHGREGLKWLKSQKPDLIISDVMMPEMDGYEFLAQLKSLPAYRGIPVVMLTARAAEEDLLQGLSLGVDDYIIKPFNAKELRIRVHNLLTNQQIRKEWSLKPLEAEEVVAVPTEDTVLMEKIKAFVEQNVSNATLSIADLGDYLAMSERQVYRKAATLAGMTPAQLIKEIRLRIAHKMLMERKVSKVAELAKRVGFENSSYFSRQFLERYGKRPVDLL